MCSNCCGVHKVAYVLLVIGGLNWGLIGVANFDLVKAIFGTWPMVVSIIYILVGLSAVAMLGKKMCKGCKMDKNMMDKKM